MSLLSFIKEAGAKILGSSQTHAATDPAAANQMAANAIKQHLVTSGLDPSGITIAVDQATHTVNLSGTVASTTLKEKLKVAAGNVEGIAVVNDDAVTVTTADPKTVRYHTVKSGDTLSAIAKTEYGNANEYPRIFEANKPMLTNPNKIYPGQVLIIPQ